MRSYLIRHFGDQRVAVPGSQDSVPGAWRRDAIRAHPTYRPSAAVVAGRPPVRRPAALFRQSLQPQGIGEGWRVSIRSPGPARRSTSSAQ
nr:unnamed protein product [Digitaria exilis]